MPVHKATTTSESKMLIPDASDFLEDEMRSVRRNADRRLLLEMKDDQVSLIMCLAIYGGETSLRLCRMMGALSRGFSTGS